MSYNNPKSSHEDTNDKKLSRTTVLTLVALALALVIIATAVAISNRKKAPEQLPEIPDSSDTQTPNESESETEETNPTEKPTDTPTLSTPVQNNKVPSFILPVSGELTSKHNPELQVFSPTMNDYRVHLGIDLETKENAPVYSVADGKVSKIWVDTRMGYCLAVSHSGGAVSIYKNLAETLPEGIAEGVSVRSGQLIATVGDSAMVEVGEEPHLHFEMTVDDLAVDPLKYFDEKSIESITPDTPEE